MRLSYATLAKRPALLTRLSGLTNKEFEALLVPFASQYEQQIIQPRVSAPKRVRAGGGGQKGALPEIADKLLFILVYTRIYPLLFIQGMLFELAESKACYCRQSSLARLGCGVRASLAASEAGYWPLARRNHQGVS